MKPMGKAVALLVVLVLMLGVVGTGLAADKGRIIHVSREHKVFAIGESSTPIAKARPGDILVIETEDCFDNQIQSSEDVIESIDFNRVNPATGPIYIEGAEPGDTLVVDILSIEVADRGVMVAIPGMGVLPDEVQTPTTRVLPIVGNKIISTKPFPPHQAHGGRDWCNAQGIHTPWVSGRPRGQYGYCRNRSRLPGEPAGEC